MLNNESSWTLTAAPGKLIQSQSPLIEHEPDPFERNPASWLKVYPEIPPPSLSQRKGAILQGDCVRRKGK